jgi:transposase InsO family protein
MLREGFAVARCTIERLMADLGLHGVIRGKPVRTTVQDKAAPCPGYRAITGTGKHRVQLGLEHRLDEAAHPLAQTSFDRIKNVASTLVPENNRV